VDLVVINFIKQNKVYYLLVAMLLMTGCHTDFWSDVDRNILETTNENRIAVSCHNCYINNSTSVSETTDLITAAKNAGADLIELDLRYDSSRGTYGDIIIAHAANDTGPTFNDVIAYPDLKNSDQMLFLEIKRPKTSEVGNNSLLYTKMIADLRTEGYLSNVKRPVYIRSFDKTILDDIYSRLTSDEKQYCRFSLLLQNEIRVINDAIINRPNYLNMVEFRYDAPDLFSAISLAANEGLAVNVYTVNTFVEVWATAFRNKVQAITIDAENKILQPQSITTVRNVIKYVPELLYVNVMDQLSDYFMWYYNQFGLYYKTFSSSAGMPEKIWDADISSSMYGGSLAFEKDDLNTLEFQDFDNDANGGFLVSAVVQFNDLYSPYTQAIVNKSETGGFALELSADKLRFGVHVNGAYHYAELDKTHLSLNHSYHIVGAYDGNGKIHIWLSENNANRYVHDTNDFNLNGGVTQNNVPITIGADPQINGSSRFHFSGKIQSISVNKWNNTHN